MRASRCDQQTAPAHKLRQLRSQPHDIGARARDVGTNPGPEFDDGLMHLRLDPFLQRDLSVFQNLLDTRAQSACLRIDDLEFLLDPESENMSISHVGYLMRLPRWLVRALRQSAWRRPHPNSCR